MKVFLDPGHGGDDSGAACEPLVEKKLNLQLARAIFSAVQHRGHEVVWSRINDRTMANSKRADKANAAWCDVLISVHHNAAGSTRANGIEVLHYPRSKLGKPLADAICNQVFANWPIKNRGAKARWRGGSTKTLSVIGKTRMPAVLIEAGFITGTQDRGKCFIEERTRRAYYETVAQAVVDAIDVVFGSNS